MKRATVICLCLLLVLALAAPAMAAGAVQFYMSSSAATVSRGDTVTISVSVSSGEPATSFGLSLSYDSSVFELVNGTCAAAGALVNSFSNGFAFMFQAATPYNGSVGTVTLRVRDSAPFGTYSVSGSASCKNGSDAVAAYGSSVAITVACSHSYGACTETADGHQQTCSVCQHVNSQPHNWDGVDVLKPANCKEGGQSKYTCTACGATKTEDTPISSTHAYGAWSKVDGNSHTHTCADCGKTETSGHTWDGGNVTRQPTCIATGEMVYTCTGCSETRSDTVPTLTTHTYDHGCDTDCNVCGATRTTSHVYGNDPKGDSSGHWYECVHCREKANIAGHLPGAEPTEENPQICVICNYILRSALTHTHKFAEEWTSDEKGHWFKCAECDEQGSYSEHFFDSDCDADCNSCGYAREASHTFSGDWEKDESGHWHPCTVCGMKDGEAVHQPGPEATVDAPQTCTVCQYELAPVLEPEGTEATEPATPDPAASGGVSGWLVLLLCLLSAAAGSGATLLASKRLKKKA